MEIEIRAATKEDASSLANIIVESWKSAYSELIPEDEIARYLDKDRRKVQFEKFIEDGEIVLIGLFNEIPCGLVFANKDNDEGLENCGSIYSIYLLEETWGKGVRKYPYGFMRKIYEQGNFMKSTALTLMAVKSIVDFPRNH